MTYREAMRTKLKLGDSRSIEARDTVAAVNALFDQAAEADICLRCYVNGLPALDCDLTIHQTPPARGMFTQEKAERMLAELREKFAHRFPEAVRR